MKKTKAVLEAEAALATAQAAEKDAQAKLAAAHTAVADALRALNQAAIDADANRPQCDMFSSRLGKKVGEPIRVVIDRRTPSGRLVVRTVGSSSTMSFKFDSFTGRWIMSKGRGFSAYTTELDNVPPEYEQARAEA